MVNTREWIQLMDITMPEATENPTNVRKFSDFAADEHILDGDKLKIADIVNREIEIIGYRITDSKFTERKHGKCLTVQFNLGKKTHVFFTGSEVLIRQIEKYKEHIPFLSTIQKHYRYYVLS